MKSKSSEENEKNAKVALKSKGAEEDSDVDEDQVADLSAVPTPVIGFKMPKLNSEQEERIRKKALSANLLNNTIVSMRSIVEKAKFFEEIQCKRKIKRLVTNTKASNPAENKADRLQEDINAFKFANNDDVSKFAILNKKSRSELLSKKDITPSERGLCLLATSKTVLKAVDKFRKTYDDWETRTAYFLQRLGQQYQGEEKKKEKKDKKKRKNVTVPSKETPAEDIIIPETSQAVVKRIKLSEGGLIDVKKPSVTVPEKQENPVNDEEEEDDEEMGFFLNSSGSAPKLVKKHVIEKEKRTFKPKEEQNLHPSWAAKLKKKKQMENIKPQGKKIVFDED